MTVSPEGIALIKEFEAGPTGGPALTAYLCPAGKWTVSWGVTGPAVYKGLQITMLQAEEMFLTKLQEFDDCVAETCPVATSAQHDAMTALCYNIGTGAFRGSTVARLHNAKDYAAAARAFLMWSQATGADGKKHVLRGLTRRRSVEMALYLSDDGIADPQRTRAADVVAPTTPGRDKTVIGTAVGAASLLGSNLPVIAQQVSDTQGLLVPLMGYLPVLQKAFLVLGLIGLGIALVMKVQQIRCGR